MILLRLLYPDDVIEQQVAAIAGRKPLVRQAGPADHHGLQLADFRMNAKFPLHTCPRALVHFLKPEHFAVAAPTRAATAKKVPRSQGQREIGWLSPPRA